VHSRSTADPTIGTPKRAKKTKSAVEGMSGERLAAPSEEAAGGEQPG